MSIRIEGGFRVLSFHRINCDIENYADHNAEKEIENWITENCEGEYYIAENRIIVRKGPLVPLKIYVAVFLKLETDVMALKLRWS